MSRGAFKKLRYAHVCALLDIIDMSQLNEIPHIRRLFTEKAEGFEEVVSFLTELGMIDNDGQILRLKSTGQYQIQEYDDEMRSYGGFLSRETDIEQKYLNL